MLWNLCVARERPVSHNHFDILNAAAALLLWLMCLTKSATQCVCTGLRFKDPTVEMIFLKDNLESMSMRRGLVASTELVEIESVPLVVLWVLLLFANAPTTSNKAIQTIRSAVMRNLVSFLNKSLRRKRHAHQNRSRFLLRFSLSLPVRCLFHVSLWLINGINDPF